MATVNVVVANADESTAVVGSGPGESTAGADAVESGPDTGTAGVDAVESGLGASTVGADAVESGLGAIPDSRSTGPAPQGSR